MKKVAIIVFKYMYNMVYSVCKLSSVKEKAVLISRQSNEMSIDFELIKKEFEKKDVNVSVMCRKIELGFKSKIGYSFYLLKMAKELATSKYCVVDGYAIPVSVLKHKSELRIVQIWHSMGAIKKFGYQILDRAEGSSSQISELLDMHKGYTHVIAPSEVTKKIYSQAFNVPEELFKIIGMPRVDYLVNSKGNLNKKIYEKYSYLKNSKKTIVYVPTFRKNKSVEIDKLVEKIDHEKYNLIIRLHPLDKTFVDEKYTVSSEFSTYDLIEVADIIVTDYSAISIEASILNKPIYFYMYDIEEYSNDRGLNINLENEIDGSVSYNVDDLIKIIEEEYNFEGLKQFREKYIEVLDGKNTEKIINLLMRGE